MAHQRRRGMEEEHANHEAWAIPYADLLTLLLAFFVVMYALSSVNEGKYRVLAASLASAFGGPPRSVTPIQLGESQVRGSSFDMPAPLASSSPASPAMNTKVVRALDRPVFDVLENTPVVARRPGGPASSQGSPGNTSARSQAQLQRVSTRIKSALEDLVKENLVRVRYNSAFIEVEIQSDILFASGVAVPSPVAVSAIGRVGEVLREEPNAIRVEGYTDDVPISTPRFPSNWELSASRAASVVHELVDSGVHASRLAVAGFGEFQPIADNGTAEGRNRNRRVLLVILSQAQGVDTLMQPAAVETVVEAADAPPAAPATAPAGTDVRRVARAADAPAAPEA